MKFNCEQCGKEAEKPAGHVNRSRARGDKLYCDRACAGLGRRKWKTKAQRVEEKRIYDEQYRNKNIEVLKDKKKAYFRKTYDPEAARVYRKSRMHLHIEYCRQPEYVEKKKQYDRKHRAIKAYGDLWECFLLTQDIRNEALKRETDYDIRLGKGQVAKSQKRKRSHARSHSAKLEIGPLGYLKQGQRR